MSVDLAALVASPHWRWMPGMRATYGHPDETGPARLVWAKRDGVRWYMFPDADRFTGGLRAGTRIVRPLEPDLADPATLGCLLALVREAWSDPEVFTRPRPGITKSGAPWACYTACAGIYGGGTEAEALAAALLAALPKTGAES